MKYKTIRDLHDAYDSKQINPVELTQQLLNDAKKNSLNAVISTLDQRAMDQADVAQKILDKEGKVPRERLPLFGVPMGIKDLLCMDGTRTTCASKMLENYTSPYTATAVKRLEDAGAISIAKLNLDEFAMGGSNENSAFGPVRHPQFPDRVPGGSSGGSAAAVGSGLCIGALGTDTGGSIRLPSSFCGIFGLKPTYGRISRYGLVAFASSLDQIGPMTHSVEDAAILLDVMSGHDPQDSTSAQKPATQTRKAIQAEPDWKKLRIGVPKEYRVGGLSPAVAKSFDESLDFFKSKGAQLIDISLPHTPHSVAVYYLLAVSEASSNLSRYDGVRYGIRPEGVTDAKNLDEFYCKVRANFGPEVKRRIILGTFALSSGYQDAFFKRAGQVRALIQQDFFKAFEKVDLIAGPVAPDTAFKIGDKIKDPLQMYLFDIFTIPANLAGIPAASIPQGKDAQGLPIGLHLQGPQFGEDLLLQVANHFKGRA